MHMQIPSQTANDCQVPNVYIEGFFVETQRKNHQPIGIIKP